MGNVPLAQDSLNQNRSRILKFHNKNSEKVFLKPAQKKIDTNFIEHVFNIESEVQLMQLKKSFQLRKNNPYLVSAIQELSFKRQNFFWDSRYQVSLYLEKVPINLSNLSEIPFSNMLHLCNQCLNGFQQLSSLFGYFHVNELLIGINSNQVVKVWLSENFKQSKAQTSTIQWIMVRQILVLIQNKISSSTMPQDNPSFINFMYRRQNRLTFAAALVQMTQFAKKYNYGDIPQKLQCLNEQSYSEILFSTERIERQSLPQYKIKNSQTNFTSQKLSQTLNNELIASPGNEIKVRVHTFNRQSIESEQTQKRIFEGLSKMSDKQNSTSKIKLKNFVNANPKKLSLKNQKR